LEETGGVLKETDDGLRKAQKIRRVYLSTKLHGTDFAFIAASRNDDII
jgi:hypothetical protein